MKNTKHKKSTVHKSEATPPKEEKVKICPKCHSTNLSVTEKGKELTVYKCNDCNYGAYEFPQVSHSKLKELEPVKELKFEKIKSENAYDKMVYKVSMMIGTVVTLVAIYLLSLCWAIPELWIVAITLIAVGFADILLALKRHHGIKKL